MSERDGDVEVEITALGHEGDGVADVAGRATFVPFALPGERWRLRDGAAPEQLSASASRARPPCSHFGHCGGCVAQHMGPELYRAWKERLVAEAFRHRGIAAEVRPLVTVAGASRRRAFFGIERRGDAVVIGFREEGRHSLVDLSTCTVLDPAIVAALPGFRGMARLAMRDREGGRLVVTKLDFGLDVAFENGRRDLSPAEKSALAEEARRLKLVRLEIAGEVIIEPGPVQLSLGGIAVTPPPAVFLQAVPAAERVLSNLVLAALPKRGKTALDLFSGLGTLTLPLATRVAVTALDSDKRAIGALASAVRHAQGLKPVEARVRDLFREPLSARELAPFDVVVFDPPRAGAHEQAERLAKSKVPVVIAVSCNPATLARDARVLIDGGYAMGAVTPVDQFLYSAHVEAVAVFKR